MKVEQEIVDDHKLHVMDLVDHLKRLVEVSLPTKPVTGTELLRKRIDQVEKVTD